MIVPKSHIYTEARVYLHYRYAHAENISRVQVSGVTSAFQKHQQEGSEPKGIKVFRHDAMYFVGFRLYIQRSFLENFLQYSMAAQVKNIVHGLFCFKITSGATFN